MAAKPSSARPPYYEEEIEEDESESLPGSPQRVPRVRQGAPTGSYSDARNHRLNDALARQVPSSPVVVDIADISGQSTGCVRDFFIWPLSLRTFPRPSLPRSFSATSLVHLPPSEVATFPPDTPLNLIFFFCFHRRPSAVRSLADRQGRLGDDPHRHLVRQPPAIQRRPGLG